MGKRLIDDFMANVGACPGKLCLCCGSVSLTYSEVAEKVLTCANALQQRYGVKSGNRVVLSAVASSDYVIAFLAAQYLGAVTVPVDKLIKNEALLRLVEYIGPTAIITSGKIVAGGDKWATIGEIANVAEISPIVKPPAIVDDSSVAEILFTTGTTGTPKGVMLGHESVRHITQNTIAGIGMATNDVVLIPLPLNHSVGMRVLRSTLSLGATVVLQDGFAFAHEIEDNINRFCCTGLVCVPTSIELLMQQMQSNFSKVLGKLRYIEIGAGSLSVPMKKKIVAELPNTTIYNTWGSSETGGALFLNVSRRQDKLESLGRPVEGVEFSTLRPDGSFAVVHNAESAGRMALKGGMRMLGYYSLQGETEKTLRGEWLVTNDLAYADADGFIYMLGRADDIINVGGEKVAPIEVENIAIEYLGVRECACIGVSDPLTGQVPALYYVADALDFSEANFKSYIAKKAARYQVPKHFIKVGGLPRNRMSKLDRKALKQMWLDAQKEESVPHRSAIEVILTRKSVRDFTDEAVSRESLDAILSCAIQAPTAHNMQTWRFTVITKQDVISRFKDILTRKAKNYKAVCYGFNNPPVAILITNDQRNRNAAQDSSCAAENIMLAAHSLGLGSVWNNTISYMQDDPELRMLLDSIDVPARHIPWVLLLLGHPALTGGKSPQRRTDVVKWI